MNNLNLYLYIILPTHANICKLKMFKMAKKVILSTWILFQPRVLISTHSFCFFFCFLTVFLWGLKPPKSKKVKNKKKNKKTTSSCYDCVWYFLGFAWFAWTKRIRRPEGGFLLTKYQILSAVSWVQAPPTKKLNKKSCLKEVKYLCCFNTGWRWRTWSSWNNRLVWQNSNYTQLNFQNTT